MREAHLFWEFSKDFVLRIEAPTCIGILTEEDSVLRKGKIIEGRAGSIEEGNVVSFYWMIDDRGIVLDALFQAFGDAVLIGCAEFVCEMSIRKPYRHVLDLHKEKMGEIVLGKGVQKSIPTRFQRCITIILEACSQIGQVVSGENIKGSCHEEWEALSKEEKKVFVREAIEEYVAPYLRRDGGDIKVIDISSDNIVQVSFHGACVECFAFGSTLSYVQHILKDKVHPSIEVQTVGSHY